MITVIAPHAKQEYRTGEIAAAIARHDYNIYIYRGKYVTSHKFDDPLCLSMISQSRIVITVHGCSGPLIGTMLGGKSFWLKYFVFDQLKKRGFRSVDTFLGLHPSNICNLAPIGIQLELTRPLRDTMDVKSYSDAVREAIKDHGIASN